MDFATHTQTVMHYPISDWHGTKRVPANSKQMINAGVDEPALGRVSAVQWKLHSVREVAGK
jgi:hypothetical protein